MARTALSSYRHCIPAGHTLPVRGVLLYSLLLLLAGGVCPGANGDEGAKPAASIEGDRGWLDNGVIRVGVDRRYGGAIVYAADCNALDNLVNIHDKGRQIQQSYYAGTPLDRTAEGQSPHWSPWPWNPVQAGNFDGDASEVLQFEAVDGGTALLTRCQPRLWDMDEELARCRFSQRMQFEDGMNNVVRVTNTIVCFREPNDIWGPPTEASQELPAVYLIRRLSRMLIYDGPRPWTGGELTRVRYGPDDTWIWTRQTPTEPWAACVDPATQSGLGVYSPAGAGHTWNMGWVGDEPGGAFDAATMHFAPIGRWSLGRDTERTWRYWIIIGTIDDIRARVYELHQRYGSSR